MTLDEPASITAYRDARPIHISGYDRQENDFYPTPEWVTEALLSCVTLRGAVWEPCCGDGGMARTIAARGHQVIASDIADRGFGLTDRPSTLFGGIGEPPEEAYHQVDRRPGYYGGLTWRHHDWLELRALRYDNRADPYAETTTAYAWHTRFSSVGARLEPTEHWTFIAQYLDGTTTTAADIVTESLFVMNYRTAFALASFKQHRERFSVRFDDFQTHQVSGYYGLPPNELGHAWTLGWMHDFGHGWTTAAEWIRATSVFPPRVEYAESDGLIESQLQLAVRYRIHASL